ncbi:hypothetical protein D9758_007544 [Tetrapyrgos nigripes]|uniref:TEA domain-containing protein n=1 Tax=Tetrapyrgos nigripes TaxID=182062 RepID=A0A8H5G809_9AGAR|nr:hypothetical protein D9758_007544 [Tetrapyrgos nigripes]
MGREALTRQDAYAGQLFCHGYGCPLLNPEPNVIGTQWGTLLQDIYAKGIRVGDVGLIRPSGDYCSLFNIFRAKEDPINTVYGVPSDFQPLEFRPNLLFSTLHHYHPPNARICSKHTREVKIDAEGTVLTPGMPFGPGIGLEMQFSRSQGAVLLLPAGARRVDYDGLPDIREYAKKHAASWYRYLNDQVRIDAHNGSLYLITGFDRTNCYENVAFQSSSKASSFSLRFSSPLLANGDFGRLSLSYSSLPEHEHWRGTSSPGHMLDNLSPFIRGFKIMIKQDFRYRPSAKLMDLTKTDPKALIYRGPVPNLAGGSPSSSSLSGSDPSHSPAPSSASFSSGSSSTRSSRHRASQHPSPHAVQWSPATSYSSLAEDIDSVRSDSLSPRGSSILGSDLESESGLPVFQLHHPGDIINEYILDKCPDALVAITHDKEWAAILEETDSQFPDNFTLISRMLRKFPSKFHQDDTLFDDLSPTTRHVDMLDNDKETAMTMPIGRDHSRSHDDDQDFPSRRHELNLDKPIDICSPVVKTEDMDTDFYSSHCDRLSRAYADQKRDRELQSAGSEPFSFSISSWETSSATTATPSLVSDSSLTMNFSLDGNTSRVREYSLDFGFVKTEDLDNNLSHCDRFSPGYSSYPGYRKMQSTIFQPHSLSIASWEANSVGAATPRLICDSFATDSSSTQGSGNNGNISEAFRSIFKGRKSWKTQKGGEIVWPPELEAALLEGLAKYQPDNSRETVLLGRYPMRNRFISEYILRTTGKYRTAKQVGSRLQQLRNAPSKELQSLLSPVCKQDAPTGISKVPIGNVKPSPTPLSSSSLPGDGYRFSGDSGWSASTSATQGSFVPSLSSPVAPASDGRARSLFYSTHMVYGAVREDAEPANAAYGSPAKSYSRSSSVYYEGSPEPFSSCRVGFRENTSDQREMGLHFAWDNEAAARS